MDDLMKAAGRAHATCWQVVDCGLQRWSYGDNRWRMVREIAIAWEFWDPSPSGRHQTIEQRYNLSFWPSAKLHRHLVQWLRRPLTEAERAGAFDFRALVNLSATLTIEQRGSYYNIADVNGAPYNRPAHRAPIYLMLQDFQHSQWDRLSPRHRDRIMESPTYLALFGKPENLAEEFPADYVRPATTSELLDGDEIPW